MKRVAAAARNWTGARSMVVFEDPVRARRLPSRRDGPPRPGGLMPAGAMFHHEAHEGPEGHRVRRVACGRGGLSDGDRFAASNYSHRKTGATDTKDTKARRAQACLRSPERCAPGVLRLKRLVLRSPLVFGVVVGFLHAPAPPSNGESD